MGLLDGKAGLVTGAGAGIGRASALAFAAEGARVVVADIDEDAGAATVESIRAAGGEGSFCRADVADEPQVERLVATVVDRYGSLDWAHNNAGTIAPAAPITHQEKEWWDRLFGISLLGMMFGLKYELRQMLAQGDGGAIVNTASTSGLIAGAGTSAYAAAKWGVIGLTKTAAMENGHAGIRVNAICPSVTSTPMFERFSAERPARSSALTKLIPMGRVAEAREQADAAVWLCSPRASFITGVALPVDGGQTLGGVPDWK